MAMTKEERAERDKARKRKRYAEDPEHRAAKLAANKMHASYNPEYHARRQAHDPEYVAQRAENSRRWNRAHITRLNAYIAAAKDRPCTDCGRQLAPYCMEFDHVRGTKLFNLSKAARRNRSLEEVQREIDKCEVRCVVCHRTRHFASDSDASQGSLTPREDLC